MNTFSPRIIVSPQIPGYIALQLYPNWRLQNAFRSAYLIFNACDRHPGANVSIISLGGHFPMKVFSEI